jgi:hypothetical protein
MKNAMVYFLILFLISCKKSDSVQTTAVCSSTISYKNQVHSIFVANCTSSNCHDGNALPSLGEYLTAHDAATQIKSSVKSGVMPKNGTLSASDKSAIICWIDNGALNN